MFRSLICWLVLLLAITGKPTQLIAQSIFPESWCGTWEGQMMLYRGTDLMDSVKVHFEVAKIADESRWIWRTTYLGRDTIAKDYILQAPEAGGNVYRLDEQNDIYLDCTYLDDRLYSAFSVNNQMLFSEYRMEQDRLISEISIWGNAKAVTEDIDDFKMRNLQRVVLLRKQD